VLGVGCRVDRTSLLYEAGQKPAAEWRFPGFGERFVTHPRESRGQEPSKPGRFNILFRAGEQ